MQNHIEFIYIILGNNFQNILFFCSFPFATSLTKESSFQIVTRYFKTNFLIFVLLLTSESAAISLRFSSFLSAMSINKTKHLHVAILD